MDGSVAVTNDAPRLGGRVKAEGAEHAPKLLWGGLRTARVPRSVNGEDTEEKASCRGGGDGNVKDDHTAGQAFRSWDSLAVQITTDSSNDSPFRRTVRSTQSRRFKYIVTRNKNTRSYRRRRLGLINNPNMRTGSRDMMFYGIGLHDVMKSICVNRKEGETLRGWRKSSNRWERGREKEKEDKQEEKMRAEESKREKRRKKRKRNEREHRDERET
jgi:hypothetical protein